MTPYVLGEVLLRINQSKDHEFPKTKERWANFINMLHDSAIDERQSIEATWARNISYYLGYQHLVFDAKLRTLELDNNRDDEYIINRIAPFVEQRCAKLTRSKPILTVLPDKIEPDIVKAAEISEHLSKYLWKIHNKDEKLDEAVLLMLLCGSSFKKVVWNADGGEPILDEQDEKGNLMFDEDGTQRNRIVFLGDIENFVRSPFDILASPGAKSIPASDWIIERSHRTILDIKSKFKDFDPDMVKDDWSQLTKFERFVNNLGFPYVAGSFGFSMDRRASGKSIKDYDIILVKEFWMKPNKIYPQGVIATVAGGQLLQFESWPYDHMRYPFVKIDAYRNPAGFYGISPVTRLIPLQKHYNQARTQIARNAQLMANPKWWVPKGSGLADSALTDEEGEVVETNPSYPQPRQIAVAPLPNYIIENQNQDIMDIRDIGGERAIDQAPFSRLTAGVALETAAELADIGIGPTLKNIERALIEEGRQELMLANQFYTDERTLKILGPSKGEFAVIKFKNTDLKYQTDLSLQLESALGQSKSSQQAKLIDLWDRRIIVDPAQFKKAYVSGNIDIILKEDDPAEMVVIEDIDMIKQGKNPVISQYDNHIVYIRMLGNFMQTPEFRKMPQDRQMIAANVLQQHLAFLQPQQPMGEQNPAAVATPFGMQVPEGMA